MIPRIAIGSCLGRGRPRRRAVVVSVGSGNVPAGSRRETVRTMTYKATQRIVRRVMPLLERLATRTIDRARLLQYLSARAGEDWGVLELIDDSTDAAPAMGATTRLLVFRDRLSGSEHQIRYPACLDASL